MTTATAAPPFLFATYAYTLGTRRGSIMKVIKTSDLRKLDDRC